MWVIESVLCWLKGMCNKNRKEMCTIIFYYIIYCNFQRIFVDFMNISLGLIDHLSRGSKWLKWLSFYSGLNIRFETYFLTYTFKRVRKKFRYVITLQSLRIDYKSLLGMYFCRFAKVSLFDTCFMFKGNVIVK